MEGIVGLARIQSNNKSIFLLSDAILTAGTRKFVGAISTVIRAITHPSGCDAFPIPTLELLGPTCCQCIYDRQI